MKKLFFSIALVLALLIGQTSSVFAQDTTPPATPITGTVQTVTVETDAAGITTVLVTYTYTDSAGVQQTTTSRLSLETATSLKLVTTDPTTNTTTADSAATGTTVTIDPATVLPEPTPEEEEPQHPVGSALNDFFSDALGVDYDTIMTYHEDGTGFGVIAQALWMTNQLDGDSDTFAALLDAKKSGDYSAITLADGSTPDNWGDVVRSLKKGSNLGSVKSGHAPKLEPTTDATTPDASTDATTTDDTKGNGNKDKDKNNGNGKEKDNDKGNHGKGNGKP